MSSRIYLDNASTTIVRPEVLEAMLPYFSQFGHNPSSVHAEGRAAKTALEQARERIAHVFGAKPREIVLTASGSEADTLAITGVAHALLATRRAIAVSAIEHHAVLHAAAALRDEGFDVREIPVDAAGRVPDAAFDAAVTHETALASVMYVNNELGTIAPIAQLAAVAHAHGALFHTDAVQAAGYLPLEVRELGIDLLTIAAHKFCGPKGAGALFVRDGTPIVPLVYGGGQERGRRAGTENVAAAIGMAAALELAASERAEASARVAALRDLFEKQVLERIPDVRITGAEAPRAPHISNVSFLGVESEALLLRLDVDGIAVSAGSACASGVVEPSHVIAAAGLPPQWARGVIRFSFGRTSTQGEAVRSVQVLERAVSDLRSMPQSPLAVK